MAIRYSGSLKISMKRLATNNRHLTALAICRVTISRGKQTIWSRELGTRTGPGGKIEAEDYDDLAEYALREASLDVSVDGVRMKGGGGYYVSRSASGPRGTRPNGASRPAAKKSATMRNPQRPSRANGDEAPSVSAKHFSAYKSALSDPMGISFNDSFNVSRYGITHDQYRAIDDGVARMVGHMRGDKRAVTLRQFNSFLAGDKVFLSRADDETRNRVISAFRNSPIRRGRK